MIGEQLQGNHFDDRQQQFGSGGDEEDIVGNAGDLAIALGGHRHQAAVPGSNFLHHVESAAIAQYGIGIMLVAGGQHDDGKFFIDQRVRPVLQFSGGITFGVRIGDFLELERALARDGVVNAASEV